MAPCEEYRHAMDDQITQLEHIIETQNEIILRLERENRALRDAIVIEE